MIRLAKLRDLRRLDDLTRPHCRDIDIEFTRILYPLYILFKRIYVYEIDSKVVGMVMQGLFNPATGGLLFVDKQYRHNGIGRQLYKYIEHHIISKYGRMELISEPEFLEYYLRKGYVIKKVLMQKKRL